MKLLLMLCVSLFSLMEVDYIPQGKKDSIVVVARPEAKDVFVALIDGNPYLVEASDIQSLERLWPVWKSVERIRRNAKN